MPQPIVRSPRQDQVWPLAVLIAQGTHPRPNLVRALLYAPETQTWTEPTKRIKTPRPVWAFQFPLVDKTSYILYAYVVGPGSAKPGLVCFKANFHTYGQPHIVYPLAADAPPGNPLDPGFVANGQTDTNKPILTDAGSPTPRMSDTNDQRFPGTVEMDGSIGGDWAAGQFQFAANFVNPCTLRVDNADGYDTSPNLYISGGRTGKKPAKKKPRQSRRTKE